MSHTIAGARIGRKTTFPGGEPRHSRALRGRVVITDLVEVIQEPG